jgi:hypothetical protein
MATINHYGPYDFTVAGGMAPGGVHNVVWWGGTSGIFDNATINVTGHPWQTTSGGQSAVFVHDMSIEHVPQFGAPSQVNAYATFGNDGSTTITIIRAFLTVTKP